VTGFKKCCISSAVDETDDMSKIVRSECEEDEGTNCEDEDSDIDS
jgi:hypothetical protein